MAEKIVSPGVFTRENDLSFLSQGIGEIGAAIIGPTQKGPAFVPTVINTQSDFDEIFGTPDGTYYTGYTVQNYLREVGTVTVVRVGHLGGYTQAKGLAIKISGSDGGQVLAGTLFNSSGSDVSVGFNTDGSSSIDSQHSASAFSISGSFGEVSSSVLYTAGNDISDVFGQSPYGSKTAYAYNWFQSASYDQRTYISDSGSQVVLEQLPDNNFTNDAQHATTPYIVSQLISGERHNLFRFHTLGDGTYTNQQVKISIFNVKEAGSSNSTDYATFSVVVRKFGDTDKRKSVLETFNNVNLDPTSPQYIAKVIGDRNVTIDANGKQTDSGDYRNNSKYIRVDVNEGFPITSGPFGHLEYENPVNVTTPAQVPAVKFSISSNSNTASSKLSFSGIDLETPVVKKDNHNYLAPLPSSPSTGSNVVFAFDGGQGLSYELTGSTDSDNKIQSMLLRDNLL